MAPDTVSTTLRELSAKITLDNQELFANHAEQLKFQDYFKGLVVIFFTIRFKTEHSSDPTLDPETEALRTALLDEVQNSEMVKKYDEKARASGHYSFVDLAKAGADGMDLSFFENQLREIQELGLL